MPTGTAEYGHDLLEQIPSPSTRLWAGLSITLSIFVVFAVYTIHEIRGLESFQANVVQRNRKASLQLLRLHNDAYLLAISLRDMALAKTSYPIPEWRAGFDRLREDMNDALTLEGRFGLSTPGADAKRAQLRAALDDFWHSADQVFDLARRGEGTAARRQIESKLGSKRAVISEIVARLLVLNDQAQSEAAERINSVYGDVRRNILLLIAVLFLLALATGLYTFQANRKTFERLHHLAERLQTQSDELRRLSWKLIDVQEETLRQVARDMHDEFGQILTALGLMLNRMRQKTLDRDSAFVQDIEAVKKTVEEALEAVRDKSQIFRPAILDDFGLGQALEWFVGQFSRQTGISVHFGGKIADGFFRADEAIHLYRIVQEALNNVARHARAREAWVTLNERDGELLLEIRDNGVGFATGRGENRQIHAGFGLMGMRERAEHLNGTFTLRTAPDQGTAVIVRIPLRRPSRGLPAEETS